MSNLVKAVKRNTHAISKSRDEMMRLIVRAETECMLGGDVDYKVNFLTKMVDSGAFKYRTLEQTIFLFKNISYFEDEIYLKDIYNFTFEEMTVLLGGLKRITEQVLASDKVLLDKYILHALNDGKGVQGTHATFNINRSDLPKFLHNSGREGRYPTKSELFDCLGTLANFQDKAIFVLLWAGIYGSGYSDLINLKSSDFDVETQTIHYAETDFDGVITKEFLAKLTDEEAFIIEQAIDEVRYEVVISKTKKVDGEKVITNQIQHKGYMESEYLLKRISQMNNEDLEDEIPDKRVSSQIIMNRIKSCKDALGKKYWKGASIYIAGIAYRMLEEKDASKWTGKDIEAYIIKNNYPVSINNLKDVLCILADKYANERDVNLEVATTKIRA